MRSMERRASPRFRNSDCLRETRTAESGHRTADPGDAAHGALCAAHRSRDLCRSRRAGGARRRCATGAAPQPPQVPGAAPPPGGPAAAPGQPAAPGQEPPGGGVPQPTTQVGTPIAPPPTAQPPSTAGAAATVHHSCCRAARRTADQPPQQPTAATAEPTDQQQPQQQPQQRIPASRRNRRSSSSLRNASWTPDQDSTRIPVKGEPENCFAALDDDRILLVPRASGQRITAIGDAFRYGVASSTSTGWYVRGTTGSAMAIKWPCWLKTRKRRRLPVA